MSFFNQIHNLIPIFYCFPICLQAIATVWQFRGYKESAITDILGRLECESTTTIVL